MIPYTGCAQLFHKSWIIFHKSSWLINGSLQAFSLSCAPVVARNVFRTFYCTWGINSGKNWHYHSARYKTWNSMWGTQIAAIQGSNLNLILNGSWAFKAQIFDVLNVKDLRFVLYEIMQKVQGHLRQLEVEVLMCVIQADLFQRERKWNHRRKDQIETWIF